MRRWRRIETSPASFPAANAQRTIPLTATGLAGRAIGPRRRPDWPAIEVRNEPRARQREAQISRTLRRCGELPAILPHDPVLGVCLPDLSLSPEARRGRQGGRFAATAAGSNGRRRNNSAAYSELADQRLVARVVLGIQIVQETAALRDELQ